MSFSNRAQAWWASSSKRARFTSVGATMLILCLVSTSVVVWNSPSNPIVEAVIGESDESIAQQDLMRQRNRLLSETVALQKKLDASKSNLATSTAKLTAIQQQLWTAQGQLAAASETSTRASQPTKKPASSAPASTIAAPSKAQILAPVSKYFGLYTEQAPFNFATFDATAAKIGSKPNVVGYFGGWDESFRSSAVIAAWKRNDLPILTWESRPIGATNGTVNEPDYTLPAIIGDPANGVAGTFDAYLHQYAKDIIATGLPLGIRLDHEMNGIWYPWSEDDGAGNAINGNRPGDYVKMWQHVHDIFQQEGANSLVSWIWAPNIVNNLPAAHKTTAYLAGLYPGDAYVDMVGLSGYLRPAYKAENDFSFDYTFGPTLTALRALTSKPIIMAEIGASETGGHKAAWISSLFQALAKPENDDILGFSWFNLAVTSYTGGELSTNDWRIDSRPESLAAFTAGLNSPDNGFSLDPQ